MYWVGGDMSSISERARVKLAEIPEGERPISERYRIMAARWCTAERNADLLEQMKSVEFAKLVMAQGDIPVSRAEVRARVDERWSDYILRLVNARALANELKEALVAIKLEHTEWMDRGASERVERRMSR